MLQFMPSNIIKVRFEIYVWYISWDLCMLLQLGYIYAIKVEIYIWHNTFMYDYYRGTEGVVMSVSHLTYKDAACLI